MEKWCQASDKVVINDQAIECGVVTFDHFVKVDSMRTPGAWMRLRASRTPALVDLLDLHD